MDITNSEGYIKDSQENPPECKICGSPLDDDGYCEDVGNHHCINSIRDPFEVDNVQ